MATVNIENISVARCYSPFTDPFEFHITLNYKGELPEDLEIDFQVTYVSSAKCEDRDQTLEHISVGPIPAGRSTFTLHAKPPMHEFIDSGDVLGVTLVLVRALFKGSEFIRVSYLVNNEYQDEVLCIDPPAQPQIDKIVRNILADQPRVTRFHINWADPKAIVYPSVLPHDQLELGVDDDDIDDMDDYLDDDQVNNNTKISQNGHAQQQLFFQPQQQQHHHQHQQNVVIGDHQCMDMDISSGGASSAMM